MRTQCDAAKWLCLAPVRRFVRDAVTHIPAATAQKQARGLFMCLERHVGNKVGALAVDGNLWRTGHFQYGVVPDLPVATTWAGFIQFLLGRCDCSGASLLDRHLRPPQPPLQLLVHDCAVSLSDTACRSQPVRRTSSIGEAVHASYRVASIAVNVCATAATASCHSLSFRDPRCVRGVCGMLCKGMLCTRRLGAGCE
jgi:hypothetical protein